MLEFFRKYQRYFFVVIAVVIVISFSFFGTHQTITAPKEAPDRVLGSAVDGSQMKSRSIDEIGRFLWSDRMDTQLAEKRTMPNFFNDGVIRKDFLSTGIGVMLADAYFDEMKESFAAKVQKHKQFRPYSHPTAPFISAEMLWGQILPMQKVNLNTFLNEDAPVDAAMFSLLVDLYLGETAFPPNILREYLMYQQKHYDWIQPDPALQHANLSLFNCSSAEDWFGPEFLQLISQFVHNSSLIAQEKGYSVSKEEARVSLFRNGYEALKSQKRTEEVSQAELGNLWKEQLLHLGMEEKTAIKVWQKVMLMRRLFEDYGHAALLDAHQYQTFHSYASKGAVVDHYELSPSLQLANFSEMLNLMFYSQAVSEGSIEKGELPRDFASVAAIEKKTPELIQKRFLVEVASIKTDALGQSVSLKEMWEWQLEEENFKVLQKEFPELAVSKADEAEGYFAALEKLSPPIRQKVNHFSRMQLVDLHPEWIRGALDEVHLETREIAIAPNGALSSLEGIENGVELMRLLTLTAIEGELKCDEAALQARNDLEQYSEDGKTYYRFHLLDRDADWSVLTFAEANKRGILNTLTDRLLENHYLRNRKASPSQFQTESGEWKAFAEVKNEVGKEYFKRALQAIDDDYVRLGGELSDSRFENLNSFYPSHYLHRYMRSAQADIRQTEGQSSYLSKPHLNQEEGKLSPREPVTTQWMLSVETKIYKNHEKSTFFDESLFAMVEKGWSSVSTSKDGKLHFFKLKEKSVPEETYIQEIKQGREILSVEAERFLMAEILETLKSSQAIHISMDEDAEGA